MRTPAEARGRRAAVAGTVLALFLPACQAPGPTPLTPEAATAAIGAHPEFAIATPDLQVAAGREQCQQLFRPPASDRLEAVVVVSEGTVGFRTRQAVPRRLVEVRSVGAAAQGSATVPVLFTWEWSWDALPADIAACVVRKAELGTATFESTAGGWALRSVAPAAPRP